MLSLACFIVDNLHGKSRYPHGATAFNHIDISITQDLEYKQSFFVKAAVKWLASK